MMFVCYTQQETMSLCLCAIQETYLIFVYYRGDRVMMCVCVCVCVCVSVIEETVS